MGAGTGAGRGKGEISIAQLGRRAVRRSSEALAALPRSGQVKRAVVQVISAMAHHGYLEQPGGEAMIEYIVQQCALPPEAEVRAPPHPPAPGPLIPHLRRGHCHMGQ